MPRLLTLFLAAILSALIVCLPGCGEPESAEASSAALPPTLPVRYTVCNRTGMPLKGVAIKSNMVCSFGEVAKGARESLKDKGLRNPRKILIRWTNYRGEHLDQTLDTWSTVGKNYQGPVTFTIGSNHRVTARRG